MPRLIKRIEDAVRRLGLGIPEALMVSSKIMGFNYALREIGAKTLTSLEEVPALRAAATALENESP